MNYKDLWTSHSHRINADDSEKYMDEEDFKIAILEWESAKTVSRVELPVKPVDYGTCKNCIFNLEESETSLVSECQLTVDEFTGIGVMFSRDFGCNQWQSKPSV